jgi:hypothetical protein
MLNICLSPATTAPLAEAQTAVVLQVPLASCFLLVSSCRAFRPTADFIRLLTNGDFMPLARLSSFPQSAFAHGHHPQLHWEQDAG